MFGVRVFLCMCMCADVQLASACAEPRAMHCNGLSCTLHLHLLQPCTPTSPQTQSALELRTVLCKGSLTDTRIFIQIDRYTCCKGFRSVQKRERERHAQTMLVLRVYERAFHLATLTRSEVRETQTQRETERDSERECVCQRESERERK